MTSILNNSAAGGKALDLPFRKMHGLGNDFIVFDARHRSVCLTSHQIAALANRTSGIGCDQLIIIENLPADGPQDAKAFMRIYNADSSEVAACGNATRCVARILMEESGQDQTTIRTKAGLLKAYRAEGGLITADMGPALLDWQQIPLAEDQMPEDKDTLSLPMVFGELENPVAVSVGNPHCIFFVKDAEAIDLPSIGPAIETHPLFPQHTNVEVVHLLAPGKLRMRVWERGVGITEACGTGACATLVAAARRGVTGRKADVVLDGGTLHIEWNEDTNHILMTGPATLAFEGTIREI